MARSCLRKLVRLTSGRSGVSGSVARLLGEQHGSIALDHIIKTAVIDQRAGAIGFVAGRPRRGPGYRKKFRDVRRFLPKSPPGSLEYDRTRACIRTPRRATHDSRGRWLSHLVDWQPQGR